ncbi:2-succinyl-5-enolpyruvyl-6-hydroxy-3-cyclohexene-1-carboxylic-acid synthase [Bacillus sp. FJAT-50079]|uniref:2-succinyl-5-enolpyruvyl-6-hydroxy-3- cyclohexene-1-carboxylic-acid synthase n=1 Tax=Bacillus sp. FJAT-50079 TaxID=2833577 RepID=UPI001BCA4C5B|nr:2-succinyl-5-enolpyruvyl-6-hydroxy-3-cyclohexene-1-carboxylic-acid synthase [Bacillus sp. FJAT-50079]MBS4208578.1 2-succinyl-5-enolpyruvyl-6-hydroxy-3-cyclohexene-1-carboxylic-acid synthase [Bacillus sp. FJAT-50079]
MKSQETLTNYLSAFIEGLEQAGVTDVVISPGSRSTPLALLFAEHPNMNVYVNIDERSAAFFALGLAKASRSPVALLCTSGTAAANFYPAVIEASLSRVPLLVLTADRPHELRDVGAPQAMNQIHLYGNHVKWFSEMAIPESGDMIIRYARKTAIRSVAEAKGLPAGPVHLNFPFREPLIPQLSPSPFSKEVKGSKPEVKIGKLELADEFYQALAKEWQGIEKGVIICGQIDHPEFSVVVRTLSEKLGFPILADPLSQLRSNCTVEDHVIDSYDAILRTDVANDLLQPELIIRFGGIPVSKPLTLFLEKCSEVEQVIIDGGRGWRDPSHIAAELLYCDEAIFCEKVSQLVDNEKDARWLKMWEKLDFLVKNIIYTNFQMLDELDEGKSIRELAELLPEDSTLFVGNSMPIRDVDTFLHKTKKNVRIMANRGANGIDGVVSTALGAAVHLRPVYLVIGDLSFFHDMNGLLAAKIYQLNINIIVLNNDGGGIFSYLPQAKEPKHFELLYGTPTGLNFEHAVKMYHGQYTKVNDWLSFQMAIMDAGSNEGLNVIEVPTDREKNTASHRRIWSQVSREINKFLQGARL